MGHAVRAFFVGTGTVGLPIGGLHQLRERLGVAFAQEVARLLPAENVARGHSRRCAMVGVVAGEEIQEQGRMDEVPALALAVGEDLEEQLLGLAAIEEVILVGRPFIGIAGRDRHAYPELLRQVEEGGDVLGGMPVEDRGIDVDPKAPGLCGLANRYLPLPAVFPRYGLVVVLLD